MSKVVTIIQARVGSTRLPGKVLKKLGGRTVISHVLQRCQAIEGVDVVCCAIPDTPSNDELVLEVERIGGVVYRGKELDVLNRYYMAAEFFDADIIVRVTSDCPLIDPNVCGNVLKLAMDQSADYATNNNPPSWPHGLDCEVFSKKWLQRAEVESSDPFEREHVTPFIRKHPEAKTVNLTCSVSGLDGHRWTLDTMEDFRFMTEIFIIKKTYFFI